MLGIYVHIPFCKNKCPYCDFVSFTNSNHGPYISALISEIKMYGKNQPVDTIFFGGGTPTSIDEKYIELIMKALYDNFSIDKSAEITIEANPGTVDEKSLKAYRDAGFNRISFGLQSCNDDELKMLGRIHDIAEFEQSYKLARKVGFNNISIDLMFGLPNQKKQDFFNTVDKAITYKPEHISCYSLKLEQGTPYFRKYYDSDALADEEAERAMYHYACKVFSSCGYIHYETSNFAKAGRQSKHNLRYWENEQYLGLGLSSHGYLVGDDGVHFRYSNVSDMDEYIKKLEMGELPMFEKIFLDDEELIDEYIMLHLRLHAGINFAHFNNRFNMDFESKFKGQIKKLEDNEMIIFDSEGIYPTLKGFDLQNTMITMFL